MNSPQSSAVERALSRVRINWEVVAWALLFVVAGAARFYALGVRAMSHDESLHALYSFYLYDQGNYDHNPMMHGPLLFHLNALAYFIFGVNDATARIFPAIAGMGVLGMTLAFRRYIGRTGALLAGVLVAISPSLLFHSRYIRNDIYIALFTLIWIYGAFRYLEERRPRWLITVTLGMVLGFIAKENHFMGGVIIGAFFAGLALWQAVGNRFFGTLIPLLLGGGLWFWLHGRAESLRTQATLLEGFSPEAPDPTLLAQGDTFSNLALLCLGAGLLLMLVLIGLSLRKPSGWAILRHSRAADLAVLMLTLVLPFAAPVPSLAGQILLGWPEVDWQQPGAIPSDIMLRYIIFVTLMMVASVGIAFLWFGTRREEIDDELTSDELAAGSITAEGEDNEANAAALEEAEVVEDERQRVFPFTFPLWAQLFALFWVIAILFFTTFLTNPRNGLASGVVGSLGYWLAQQEVARGGQPWFYYFMIGALYEFLPILLTLGGGIAALVAVFTRRRWQPVPVTDLPGEVAAHELTVADLATDATDEAGNLDAETSPTSSRTTYYALRTTFLLFALWWTVGSFAAYSYAGEKMPWLLVHMALPMCILGGWWAGTLITRVDWRAAWRSGAAWLVGIVPVAIFLLGTLFVNVPFAGREIGAISSTMGFVLALALLGGAGFLAWRWARATTWSTALRLGALGLAAVLTLATVRYSYMLTFINYDMATEYLVYAHGAPGIKEALGEIDLISERTAGGRDIEVAYGEHVDWPMSWYMRLYPNSRYYGAEPTTEAMSMPVIIADPGQEYIEKVRPYVARDYVKRTYTDVWWPDQTKYMEATPLTLWETLRDPLKRERLLQIILYRRYYTDETLTQERSLLDWPTAQTFDLYVRKDIASEIWDLGVTPVEDDSATLANLLGEREIDLAASATLTGPYADQPLLTPREIAVGPDGSRVIADTGNHRIVVLDAAGNFARAFGSVCQLYQDSSSCIDPDGDGPLELGDGQFNEPWGVAVDDAANIYVSDTWNGRVQVFDSGGSFLRKWGSYNTTDGQLGDAYALFGPRGLAVDSGGNVLVADTGNKRIVQYTPEGQELNQIGGGGVIEGYFDEPTDVVVSPVDGSVYVADAWNQRIQKFTPDLQFAAEWPVPSWESEQMFHKPYLAVAPNGDVYASDPAMYRVIVYNPAGEIKASFGNYGTEANRFALPIGLAVDGQNGALLLTDADNNRVMNFPLVE